MALDIPGELPDFNINNYLGRGARAATANPNVGTERVNGINRPSGEAQAFRASQSSIPVSENPAPLATATNASRATFGQRLLNTLRSGGRYAAKAGGIAAVGTVGAGTALDVAGKSTGDYEKELSGLGITPGARYSNDFLQLIRDTGVRATGSLVDLGRNALSLVPGLPSFGGTPSAKPAPSGTDTSLNGDIFPLGTNTASGVRKDAASGLLDSADTLASGLGIIRNNTTGAVTTINQGAGAAAAQPVSVASRPAAVPTSKSLEFGTEGGLFDNLAPFVNNRNAAVLEAARSGRDINRAVKGATIAKTGIEAENATSNRIKALAEVQKALGAGKKLAYSVTGDPVIVNTNTNRATQPTINKPVTEADIVATMKANKLTRPQVLERLKSEGRLPEDME